MSKQTTNAAGQKTGDRQQQKKAFFEMLRYAKPHRKSLGWVVLFSFFAISAELLQPYIVKIVIDSGVLTGERGIELLWLLGGGFMVLAGLSLLFTYLQATRLQFIGQSIVAKLRKDLFQHIYTQSMSFFDKHSRGSLVTNESSDTETISQFFTQVLVSLIRDGLMLILIILLMFSLDVQLALYCMIVLPVIALIAALFRRYIRNAYRNSRTQLSRLIAFTAENLAGMGLIQAFHQEKEQINRFQKQNKLFLKANIREITGNVLFNRSFDMLGNLSVAFLVWIGGTAVLSQQIEFGVLYAFISYMRQFFQPINQLTQQWNTLQSTLVSMERLWLIFHQKPEVREAKQASDKKLRQLHKDGRIQFEGVSFSYDQKSLVLKDIHLDIRPGEMVGIVGTTGSGKSTLMNLLVRFYDPVKGTILLDGQPLKQIPLQTLHQYIGLVQQEPFLYGGTLIDNVRLFQQDISKERVIAACEAVGAGPMVQRLSQGYDSHLSQNGSGLAAGERQLISFARILLFEPKVLILDEATANMDSHSEWLIQQALEKVSVNRTTLVIAHRLSTIREADRILVMKDGEIAEEGNHQELLAKNGHYATLHHHSFKERARPTS
ncbi:ATP-binding cassette subfamily B protein [Aureibacillus halotolerans]|uniref:ATP-binding cassette subfamily B protein n=1 Tax=Aureibacillus halotolerans TaxID=1508390 RepID=A0A4R6TZN2_9BACI|nr:ATP-binding cassette subfamily B protein [Aureibacillus halotolerans]